MYRIKEMLCADQRGDAVVDVVVCEDRAKKLLFGLDIMWKRLSFCRLRRRQHGPQCGDFAHSSALFLVPEPECRKLSHPAIGSNSTCRCVWPCRSYHSLIVSRLTFRERFDGTLVPRTAHNFLPDDAASGVILPGGLPATGAGWSETPRPRRAFSCRMPCVRASAKTSHQVHR
jgi:hypothetical protein